MLWIVAMPLGNPGDLSPRAAALLAEADLVLAEDTRRAGLLCQRCGVKVRAFASFHEHNEAEKQEQMLELLRSGRNIALVSDAGTPLMADPGYRLVRACRAEGLEVSPVPGPSAPVAALCASGIAPQPYSFLGFLPRKAQDQRKLFEAFATLKSTLVFFERKDRLRETLELAFEIFGARELCIARELTKTYEEFICIPLANYADLPNELLGEITVIIGPASAESRLPEDSLLRLLEEYSEELGGARPRELARKLKDHAPGWNMKELYDFVTKHS